MFREALISGIQISHVPKDVPKPMGGYPMVEIPAAELVKGRGLRSLDGITDRYFADENGVGRGAYSKLRPQVRQLSIISSKAIERANIGKEIPFTWADTRRNIRIEGIEPEELNDLIYKLFALGGVEVRGVEHCDPCDRPDKLSGKKGFKSSFTNMQGHSIGGLRVEILGSGIIYANESTLEK